MENTYELLFVSAPDLKDDQLAAVRAQVIEEMTGLGAVIEKEDDWGKRDLAFEVKDYHQGYYYLIYFKAPPDLPGKLKGYLKVNERVIRYLITKHIPRPEPPPERKPEKKPKDKDTAAPPDQPETEAKLFEETTTEPTEPAAEDA